MVPKTDDGWIGLALKIIVCLFFVVVFDKADAKSSDVLATACMCWQHTVVLATYRSIGNICDIVATYWQHIGKFCFDIRGKYSSGVIFLFGLFALLNGFSPKHYRHPTKNIVK